MTGETIVNAVPNMPGSRYVLLKAAGLDDPHTSRLRVPVMGQRVRLVFSIKCHAGFSVPALMEANVVGITDVGSHLEARFVVEVEGAEREKALFYDLTLEGMRKFWYEWELMR